MLSFDTTHAITGCLVYSEADLHAAGWGHPPLLALLHDQPHTDTDTDTDQPAGGERMRRIRADLLPISPHGLAAHPSGLPGYLHDLAAHLTAPPGDSGAPPPTGHLRIGVAAVVAALRAARRSRPGVPVRALAWAVLYEDISAVTAPGPNGVDEVDEVRRVDAVDSDGRVYQLTRRRL